MVSMLLIVVRGLKPSNKALALLIGVPTKGSTWEKGDARTGDVDSGWGGEWDEVWVAASLELTCKYGV